VGDADIGTGSNIGAGTIFANYDGVRKSHTTVGEHVFVGSNSVLIAPVTIEDGAYIAAGSAVSQDVPSGALGIARGRQHNSDSWVLRNREGTASAEAASRVVKNQEGQ
jgi:bifunctional UDP-N-acetylglucosamine pyrophosphorylase / glucosamine-1-phosphate N-acetyltransferase